MSRDYNEDTTRLDSYFNNLATSSIGVRGIINKTKIKAITKAYHFLKNYFGFEIETQNRDRFKEISNYFYEYSGVEIIPDKKREFFPNISIDKVFIADTNTIVYASWDNDERGRMPGYLYIFGKCSHKHYKYIMDHILENKSIENRSTTIYTIYASNDRDGWSGIRKQIQSRPFSTLYFDNDIEEKIKDHIDNWMKNRDTYKSRGITFKTGILLYGSPGTGKSSLASAIADYLDCNIIMIDSATFDKLNVNEVTASINADDRMYVILLDDIDVILSSRDDENSTVDQKAIIAKLLGFLDSNNSPDNVIFVATTNHIELFDSAIRRAGRFDKVIEVENISKATAIRMCKGFGLSTEDAKKLVDKEHYNKQNINPADLQVKIIDTIKSNMIESGGEDGFVSD